ncbi:MAG: carboxypeptidase-like regulatory domain-containing protein, partial [Bacteroidia bacterium]
MHILMRKQLLFTLAGLFAALGLFAQTTATIRGTVYNKNTGEAVLFGYVYIKNTALGVQTDVNGFYSLTKIPPGSYTLVAQESSFEIFEMPITVKAN